MGYDPEFYRRYEEYLQEPVVRKNHGAAFEAFSRASSPHGLIRHGRPRPGFWGTIDLGCGLGEYVRFSGYMEENYIGVDLQKVGSFQNFIQADYHDLGKVRELMPFEPKKFVSLFSIECFHSAKDKYALYEKIFAEMPSIEYGLAGGFFYESKRGQETVGETGGIVSYQTIEDPSLHISPTFDELRLHMKTPSTMFGLDVVEVWKILSRR